jgi:hypothetical protein
MPIGRALMLMKQARDLKDIPIPLLKSSLWDRDKACIFS